MRLTYRLAAGALAAASLAACSQEPPPPRAVETQVPKEFRQAVPAAPTNTSIGTPMQDRTAIVGLLNKRNNISQDLTMKPGETRRIGDVIVALKACERTAPWEMPQETGAFVQVFVQQSGNDQAPFGRVFSGWLFKESPSLNVVEHPIYDVWVKDCTMSFPGEESSASDDDAEEPARPAAPRVRPTTAPSPSTEAENEAIA